MTNHRIKFITSANLSSLESAVNSWLEEVKMNITIRGMNLHTKIHGHQMALMIWYDYPDEYVQEEKQIPNIGDDREIQDVEKVAKISSARV